MFKLKTREGFILVEILCAMTIFSMLLTGSLGIFYQSRKIKKVKDEKLKCFTFAEGLKNNLMYNSTYKDLHGLKKNNRLYINKEDMNLDNLKNGCILQKFKSDFKANTPYIKIDIIDGDVLKIRMSLYCNNKNRSRIICCQFYKGRYKR